MDTPTVQAIDVRDLDALRAQISDTYSDWSNGVVITQAMVNGYAELTGDRQWIHVDVERARRESPFGGPIVHGFFLLGLLPSMRTPLRFTVINYSSAANYGSGGLRFLSPVPVGAEIHARQRLKRVEEHRRGSLLTSEVAIHAVGNDKPALLYDLQVLYAAPASS